MNLSVRSKKIIVEAISLLGILLFVYAAVSKLLDFNTFKNQLGQSPLLSAYAHWVVWLIPAMEIFIAAMLAIPRYRKWGLYGFYGMMLMFTAYIFIILNFADFVPCSCGGILEKLGWTEHLLFNIGFIVLSSVAILFLAHTKNIRIKKILGKLLGLSVIGIVAVSLLYLGSEKQMKRNNAFIRRYMPHPIEKIGEYDLEYNSYYLAGMDACTIYLGNYNSPLFVMSLDTSLTQPKKFRISIDSMHLPYRRVRIRVSPPNFYLGDGTVPVLFKGKINKWHANVFSYEDAYFSEFIAIDSNSIGIATKSINTQSNAVGLLKKTNCNIKITLNDSVLNEQSSGTFTSDGILLWNEEHQRFIYTYFYRNRYEVINKDLSYQYTGKTIDTTSTPLLDVAHYTKTEQLQLGGSSILINKQSATYSDYLYIHSDRLGRYEDEAVLRSASIIDVYAISDNTYAFSFYLYHQPNKELTEFRVYNNLLIAIVDSQLLIYRLKPEYFNPSFKTTHTAQYQEIGRTPVKNSRPLTQ